MGVFASKPPRATRAGPRARQACRHRPWERRGRRSADALWGAPPSLGFGASYRNKANLHGAAAADEPTVVSRLPLPRRAGTGVPFSYSLQPKFEERLVGVIARRDARTMPDRARDRAAPDLAALPPWCEVARLPALPLPPELGHGENWQCGLAASLLQCSSAPTAPPSLLLGCSETELEGLLCAYPPLLRRLNSLRGEVDAWAAERAEPRSVLLAALQAARRFSAPDSSGRGFCVLPGFLGRATPCLAGTGLGCHLVSGPQHVVHTVATGREEGEKPSRCFGFSAAHR